MKTFTRKELIELRDRAQREASTPGLNPSWVTAFGMLGVAADVLDATMARSEISQGTGVPLEIGTESGWAYGCRPDCGCEKEMD